MSTSRQARRRAARAARRLDGVPATLDGFPRGVLLAWAYWEMFRRLGFSSDDLYVGAVRGVAFGAAATVVRVELRDPATGGEAFAVHAAVWTEPPARFEVLWTAFCAAVIDGRFGQDALQPAWDRYRGEIDGVALLVALQARGLVALVSDSAAEAPSGVTAPGGVS